MCFVALNKATTPLEMRCFPLQVKRNNADTFGRGHFRGSLPSDFEKYRGPISELLVLFDTWICESFSLLVSQVACFLLFFFKILFI